MKKFIKILILSLAFWQALFSPALLSFAYAQEVDSTSLTTLETPVETPTDSSTLIPSPEVVMTTGDSLSDSSVEAETNISQVTLTPDPSPTPEDLLTLEATDSALLIVSPIPTPTPSPDQITIDQSGSVSSDSSAESNSGENTQIASKSANLTTGDATSVANTIDVTNLAEVNSNLITTVQDVYTGDTGDVDLYQLLMDTIATNPNLIPVNTDITTTQNADVDTNTDASSNTGENTQNASSASINSGDAAAIASAISATNLNLVGSNMVLAVINILGDYSGDIILPNSTTVSLASLGLANLTVNANQSAVVNSDTSADANTGENSQTGKSVDMNTGDATSISNTNSFINLIQIGGGLGYLIINNSGNWTGNLVNWTAPGTTETIPQGTTSLTNSWLGGEEGAGDGDTSITSNQTASVNANVSATANTGSNIQDGKNLNLTSGNAFSLANNLSLTNITGVGTNFFFAIINIFGHWTGNIFTGPKPPTAEDPAPDPSPSDSTPDIRAPDLAISVSNNVGAFVYPGDTILANITVTNQGGIMAHGVEVKGQLTNDHPMPAIPMDWKIGDLKPGGKAKISFSITLTSDLPDGQYKIEAIATGDGESGNESSTGGESTFWVKVKGMLTEIAAPEVLAESTLNLDGQILGTTNIKQALDINKYLPYILLVLVATYIFILLARKKLKENA